MKALLQRIRDWHHERTIKRFAREYLRAMRDNKLRLARVVALDMQDAIKARSPQQWARINKKLLDRMDPHARAVMQQESRA